MLTYYNTFLLAIVKKGKIKRTKFLFDKVLMRLSKKKQITIESLLTKIYLILGGAVEIKRVRRGKRVTIIPFAITFKRSMFLSTKWILEAVQEMDEDIPVFNKIENELLNILNKSPRSLALKRRDLNIKLALQNRANSHFRWV